MFKVEKALSVKTNSALFFLRNWKIFRWRFLSVNESCACHAENKLRNEPNQPIKTNQIYSWRKTCLYSSAFQSNRSHETWRRNTISRKRHTGLDPPIPNLTFGNRMVRCQGKLPISTTKLCQTKQKISALQKKIWSDSLKNLYLFYPA